MAYMYQMGSNLKYIPIGLTVAASGVRNCGKRSEPGFKLG